MLACVQPVQGNELLPVMQAVCCGADGGIVHNNMPRIQQLWAIFEDHVAKTITHPKQGIRTATIDALGKAVVGALTRLFVVKEAPPQKQVMT